jgi:SAM-dependent methyltransferase
MSSGYEQNRRAWDDYVRQRTSHTLPASERDFQNPAPIINPCGWLPDGVAGKRVLCLAAGGGKHSVLFAAAGAVVTVVDLSPQMLAQDRQLAAERQLKVTVLEASMDDLSALSEAAFDLVIQPVSTCYVPDIAAVYRQVARVTAPGGVYISQHKQPVSLQAEVKPGPGQRYALTEPYYRAGPLPPVTGSVHREAGSVEFLHRWEELIGGMCRNGFVIEDLVEPKHANPQAEPGSWAHRSCYVPPYVTIKSRRTAQPVSIATSRLWTP